MISSWYLSDLILVPVAGQSHPVSRGNRRLETHAGEKRTANELQATLRRTRRGHLDRCQRRQAPPRRKFGRHFAGGCVPAARKRGRRRYRNTSQLWRWPPCRDRAVLHVSGRRAFSGDPACRWLQMVNQAFSAPASRGSARVSRGRHAPPPEI